VAVFVRFAADFGIGSEELLEGSRIEVSELNDPHRIITTEQEIMVGRRLAHLVPVPLIGLNLGQHHHLISKGKLGMAVMCSETVMDALQLIIKYIDLAASYFQYNVVVEGNKGRANMKELLDDDELRKYVFEAEVVSLHTICSMVLGVDQVFQKMHVAYSAPDYASRYEDFFHCPVHFDARCHEIFFDASVLTKPLRHANPLTKKMLEQECRQLCERLDENATLSDKIRHELVFSESGYPTLSQISRRINMPERTIRRRLNQEGMSYEKILTDIRRQKALEMISAGVLSMEKIAEKLGYSETAGFYHAFKSWTGTTPIKYREKSR
jgi:AraC-like DNA-binding protein